MIEECEQARSAEQEAHRRLRVGKILFMRHNCNTDTYCFT